MRKRLMITLLSLIVVSLLLMACGGGDELSAEEILAQAAENMSGIGTVKFVIERQGDPVEVNVAGVAANLISASGEYNNGDAHAIVKAEVALMGAVEADVTWIGDVGHIKAPPLIDQDFSTEEGFTLTNIFTGEGSFSNLMTSGLTNIELVGTEEVADLGVTAYHIRGQADSGTLGGLMGEVVAEGTATYDIFIDQNTFEVVRIVITEADEQGWLVDLYDYGVEVEIPAP